MKYGHYIFKRSVEDIFLFPFICIGRIIALLFPLKKQYDIYFFFPFYHTGGAEKVHALITQAFTDKKCIIFFTRRSIDNRFLDKFKKTGFDIKDISAYTDRKIVYFLNVIFRGIVSGYVNKNKSAVVFNGQCNFAYKISPWIKSSIKQIELIHSFNSFSWIRIPFLQYYSNTVMISKLRIEDHLKQYTKLNVPATYYNRIMYIGNAIPIPTGVQKDYTLALNVLYAGRGTEEKRVHLIAAMAKALKTKFADITFSFAGDVQEAIPQEFQPYCTFIGTVSDEKKMCNIYNTAHIVIITSSTEGFPMVIMEGMSYGCAILSTQVGDIPLHIHTGKNGFLFTVATDETLIIQEGIAYIEQLYNNRQLLGDMGVSNIFYAADTFDIKFFNREYRKLLISK